MKFQIFINDNYYITNHGDLIIMDSANGFGYYKASVYSSDLSPNHFISPKQLVIRDSNDGSFFFFFFELT